ncbi:unnamed protein product [Urochloa humidicola]
MGNCQTAEAAAVVIQHPPPGGRVERAHGALSAAAVMAAAPSIRRRNRRDRAGPPSFWGRPKLIDAVVAASYRRLSKLIKTTLHLHRLPRYTLRLSTCLQSILSHVKPNSSATQSARQPIITETGSRGHELTTPRFH